MPALAALLLIGAFLFASGCDTEALLTSSPTDRINRSAAVMGTEIDVFAHVDVAASIQAAKNVESLYGDELGLSEGSIDEMLASFSARSGVNIQDQLQAASIGMEVIPEQESVAEFVGFANTNIDEVLIQINEASSQVHIIEDGDTSVLVNEENEQAIAAWLDEGFGLMASDEDALYDMIARAQSHAVSTMTNDALVGLVLDTPAWAFVQDMPALLASMPPPSGEMATVMTVLSTVQAASAAVDPNQESITLQANLRPVASVDAGDLADVLRGAVAMARLQFQDREMDAVFDAIDIDDNDGNVRIRIEVDEDVMPALRNGMVKVGPLFQGFHERHRMQMHRE